MATTLYLRKTKNSLGHRTDTAQWRDLLTTRGAGVTTAVVNTAAAGTEIPWSEVAGGSPALAFISPAVSAGFTLATTDTMTFNIWAVESSMNANAGARARVYIWRRWTNALNEVPGGPWSDGVEFGTAIAVMNWTGNPSSNVTVDIGDRIVLALFITNVGTMAGGFTCTMDLEGATGAADGDSWLQLTNTVSFLAETPLDVLARPQRCGQSLAPGHPLAPRYAWFFGGGSGNPGDNGVVDGTTFPDVSNRFRSTYEGGITERGALLTPGGVKFRHPAVRIILGPMAQVFPASAMKGLTIAVRMRWDITTGPGYMDLIGGVSSGGTYVLSVTRNGIGNELQWRVNDSFTTWSAPTLAGDVTWVFTHGNRGTEIWRDGRKASSDATVRTPTVDPTNDFIVGYDDITVGFLYVYHSQLPPSQIVQLSRAPF
jgi:hypothetical protein